MLSAAQLGALADLSSAVSAVAEVAVSVSGVQALTLSGQVTLMVNQLSGVSAQVLAAAVAGRAWAGDGFVSAPRWLATTQLVAFRVAKDRVADADWLVEYPMFADALATGVISAAHITVVRRITGASQARRSAFVVVADEWVTVAADCDPDTFAALLRAWAAVVDDTEDDKAEKAWSNRTLRVSQVGDEWAISGRLPPVEGARFSAVLNAIMESDRRARCSCERAACSCVADDRTVTQRRADALIRIVDAVTARTGTTRRTPANPAQAPTPEPAPNPAENPAEGPTARRAHNRRRAATDPPSTRTGAGPEAGSADVTEPPSSTDSSQSGSSGSTGFARPVGPAESGASPPPEPPPGLAPWGSAAQAAADEWPGLAPGWDSGRLGDRTRVVLVIRAEDLTPPTGTPGTVPEPGTRPADVMSTWSTPNGPGTGFLARTTVLRELCDTTVQRLIVGPDSQPLDIGRATRTIPTHIRTALTVRDRGCTFPGCDRPSGWTEAHHIQTWASGGDTALHNLASLCSRHHHLIHTGTWTITMAPDGHPVITQTPWHPKRC